MKDNIFKFTKIHRVCIDEFARLTSLPDENILRMYTSCIQHPVSTDDGLPNLIRPNCVHKEDIKKFLNVETGNKIEVLEYFGKPCKKKSKHIFCQECLQSFLSDRGGQFIEWFSPYRANLQQLDCALYRERGERQVGGRRGYRPRPARKSDTASHSQISTHMPPTGGTAEEDDPLYLSHLNQAVLGLGPACSGWKIYSTAEAITVITETLHFCLSTTSDSYSTRVPIGALAYYVAAHTYASMLKKHLYNGGTVSKNEADFMETILAMHAPLPKILQLYVDGFGNTTLPCGNELKFSVPDRTYQKDEVTNTFGWFGKVGPDTHYLYKMYPCLAVYAMRISQDIRYTHHRHTTGTDFNPNWNLPAAIAPEEADAGLPTCNMLGYAPAVRYTKTQAAWIQNVGFKPDGTYESTYQDIPLLTKLLIAVQMEISVIDKIIKAPSNFYRNGSQAQIHLTKFEAVPQGQGEYVANITTNSAVYLPGCLTIIDGSFTYRTFHDPTRTNWSVYSYNNYANVPPTWRETINSLRRLEPSLIQEIVFTAWNLSRAARTLEVLQATTMSLKGVPSRRADSQYLDSGRGECDQTRPPFRYLFFTTEKKDPLYFSALNPEPSKELRDRYQLSKIYSTAEAITDITENLYRYLDVRSSSFANSVPIAALAYYVAAHTYASMLEKNDNCTDDEYDFVSPMKHLAKRLPKILQLYVDGFGNTTVPYGNELEFSMADRTYQKDEVTNTFGWFGKVGPDTHYLYKMYPCLAVYAMRISQDILYTHHQHTTGTDFNPNWNLPAAIAPEEADAGLPTCNMLGYAPAVQYTKTQAAWIQNAGFKPDGTYKSVNKVIPLITTLLFAVQNEIDHVNDIITAPCSFSKLGSKAQIHLTKFDAVSETREEYKSIIITSVAYLPICLTRLSEIFMYRTFHNPIQSKWCIYSFNNYANVPPTWQATINSLRSREPRILQEIAFTKKPDNLDPNYSQTKKIIAVTTSK